MKMKPWFWGISLTVLMIILGAWREIIFVNINEQLAFNAGIIPDYRVLPFLRFLNEYPDTVLLRAKWMLTMITALLYFGLGVIAILNVLLRKDLLRWFLLIYLVGIGIAALCYVLGKISGNLELGYTLARRFMGGLQSPFPLMLMIPASLLLPRRT